MATNLPFQLEDPSLFHEQSLLHGQWVDSIAGRHFDIEDPGTGTVFASCPVNEPYDLDRYVRSSQAAFEDYRHVNPRIRAQTLLRWHRLITEARSDIAELVVYETVKPMVEALGEVDYALGFAWWFAGEAERVRGSIAQPPVSNRRTLVIKQPIGVSVALVPWNFSVAMVIRKVAAALAAGCTMIVKPSPETPLNTLALVDLAMRAGSAPGVLTIITVDGKSAPGTSEALYKHSCVRKVTFTGSTSVGQIIASHCSFDLKKLTLELGCNCAFLVFNDADLQAAVEALMVLKWRTAVQACAHANRVYVQSGVYEKFAAMIRDATIERIRVGHDAEERVTMGALTTSRGLDKLERHVAYAVAKGGRILCGGHRARRSRGHFWQSTIIADMNTGMLPSREEIFGPLLAFYRFNTEPEAIKAANDTDVGLVAYFLTRDVSRSYHLLESLEAGMVGMNTGNASCAESPFGGIKSSGYGKEAGLQVAIEEYDCKDRNTDGGACCEIMIPDETELSWTNEQV